MANTSLADFIKRIQNSRNTEFSTAAGTIANAQLDFSDPMMTSAALSSRDTQQQLINTNNAINEKQERFAGYLSYLGQQANKRLAETFTPEEKPPRDRPKYKTHIPEPYDPEGTLLKGLEDRIKELEGKSTQLPEPTLSPTESTNTDLVRFKPVKARYLNQGVTQLIHGFNPETSEGWAPSHLYDPSGKHGGKDGHTHVAFKTKEDFDRAVTRAKEAGYIFSTGRDNNPGSNHNKTHAHPDGKAIDYEWRYPKGHEKAGQPIPYTPEAEKLWHTTWRDILFADEDPFRN